ncbi:MAG: hypothetical protein VX974_07995 [Pseudomonadota bacterium]|nr:hypothetical protein [Pseudomonadota bacterium]
MKKLMIASASFALLATTAMANDVTYSSQGGTNTLFLELDGTGNRVGNAASASGTRYDGQGTQYYSNYYNPYYYYYYNDYTYVYWNQTTTTSYPTDYSAAKEVGDGNVVRASQTGTGNALDFSQGSDTQFT